VQTNSTHIHILITARVSCQSVYLLPLCCLFTFRPCSMYDARSSVCFLTWNDVCEAPSGTCRTLYRRSVIYGESFCAAAHFSRVQCSPLLSHRHFLTGCTCLGQGLPRCSFSKLHLQPPLLCQLSDSTLIHPSQQSGNACCLPICACKLAIRSRARGGRRSKCSPLRHYRLPFPRPVALP
jgi:hypothetical protein